MLVRAANPQGAQKTLASARLGVMLRRRMVCPIVIGIIRVISSSRPSAAPATLPPKRLGRRPRVWSEPHMVSSAIWPRQRPATAMITS